MAQGDVRTILVNTFIGGITLVEKSTGEGHGLNFEEVDIFTNPSYMQPEQLMSSDALPASSEIYSFTPSADDTVWGYGKNTGDSKVRLFKVTGGGASNPGAWATELSSGTNNALINSPIVYHETTESAATVRALYYISGTNTLSRYNIGTTTETADFLTGLLTGSTFKRFPMLRAFGELFIGHGQFIAKVDKSGVTTLKAFTLPNGWEVVSMCILADKILILCRSLNRLENKSTIYEWDITSTAQFDNSILIPMGGPQWIFNHREVVRVLCARKGIAKWFQLVGSTPLKTHELDTIFDETDTQPISPHHSVTEKDSVIYFGLAKTDKSGIYAIGQAEEQRTVALILSRRYDTSDYSLHRPRGLLFHAFNLYAAFDDNGTADSSRCETDNSPTRSSNAVYETIVIDGRDPLREKTFRRIFLITKPLAASTSITVSIKTDYATSYTTLTRPDGTNFATTNGIYGEYQLDQVAAADNVGRAIQIRVAFTSSGTSRPQLVLMGVEWVDGIIGGSIT